MWRGEAIPSGGDAKKLEDQLDARNLTTTLREIRAAIASLKLGRDYYWREGAPFIGSLKKGKKARPRLPGDFMASNSIARSGFSPVRTAFLKKILTECRSLYLDAT